MKLSSFLFSMIFSYLCITHVYATQDRVVYLAGPLFTIAEREFNTRLGQELRNLGYSVFLPQEGEPRELTAQAIFDMDVSGVDHAQVIVAIFDGPDPDSGTCWECGYAYAKNKPVIGVRTDFRGVSDGNLAPYNLMLSESSVKQIQLSSLNHDLKALIKVLDEQLQAVFKTLASS